MPATLGRIRGFGEIAKIEGLPSLGELARAPKRARRITVERIPLRPRVVDRGAQADLLEEAALQDVPGTLPERIVWKYLLDNDYIFTMQQAEFGGQLVIGGSVVDFVIYSLGQPIALRVQGSYWHGPAFPERQARDDEHYARLTALGYHVVDVWENDLYEAVLSNALGAFMRRLLGG